MRLPRLLAGGAVVVALSGTAACGLASVEPKLQLRAAAAAFAGADSGAVRLSIGSSVDEVRAFLEAADDGSAGTTDLPDDDLQTILSASLDVGYDYGDPQVDTDDASRLILHLGDLDAGEIRYADQLLYAQVNVDGLVAEFPDMQEDVASARAAVTGADPAAGEVPPALRESATALLGGDWVSLDVQAWMQRMEEFAAQMPDAPADPGLPEGSTAKARDLIGTALRDAVVSVERKETDDYLGDHLVAKVNLRTAWAQLRAGLPELLAGPTADMMEESLPPADEVPDKDVAVSFWVNGEGLSRVELDAAEFLDEPAGHLVLRADMLPADEISAPDGAVAFDVDGLMSGAPVGGIIAGEGGTDAEETFGAPTAHDVATWVDEDFRAAAEEAGVPPTIDLLDEVLEWYRDMPFELQIVPVDQRVQVSLDGAVACLTLSGDIATEGTIVDTPC